MLDQMKRRRHGDTTEQEAHTHLSVHLMGGFAVVRKGTSISLPPNARRVVALTALRGRVARREAAGRLWPETTEDKAAANLRTTLWKLRRACRELVDAGPETLRLDPRVVVDCQEWMDRVQRGLSGLSAPGRPDRSPEAELLPGWYDDWVEDERERLRQLRLHVLEQAAREALASRHHGSAMEFALGALRIEPLRESAHRLIVEIHLAEGNAVEALRQYRACERVLREELGLAPSERLVELITEIGSGASARGA